MDRRQFILSGIGMAAGISMAGCTTSTEELPPRRSSIVNEITLQDGELVVDFLSDPTVTMREEQVEGGGVGTILPIGVASAKKGGSGGRTGGRVRTSSRSRGSRSSYRGAHRSNTGFAYYYWAADDDEWYDEHEDILIQVEPQINRVGVASIPNLEQKELGAETVAWDEIKQGSAGEELRVNVDSESEWYRIGIDLERGNSDLGWEFYDVEITEDGVGQMWKVPPRL